MTAITSTGLGSGLDVNSLVTQLMNAERIPLTQMQAKETTINSKISAFGQITSLLSTLKDAAKTLATPLSAAASKATISDSTIASVTASSGAVKGSYDLDVIDLAQNHKLISTLPAYTDKTAVVGDGTLTIQLGTYNSGTNTFTNNPDKTAVNITINPSKNTLADIRDAINNASAGVTASIINDGTGARLSIASNESGNKNSIKITTSDGDGTDNNTTGLSQLAFDPTNTAGSGKNMTQTTAAKDAHIKLDGVDITNSSNTLSNVIDNLTINLSKATTATVKVGVERDTDAISKSVQTLVDAFNNYASTSKSLTNYDITTKTGSTLNGEGTVKNALSNLKRAFTGSLGSSNTYNTLSEVGISIQQDGTFKLDTTKLNSAIASNPDAVTKLFVESGTSGQAGYIKGFGAQIYSMATDMLASNGLFQTRVDSLNANITSLNKQEDAFQLRLDAMQKRYQAQFQSLDTMMSSWNSTSSYLTQQFKTG